MASALRIVSGALAGAIASSVTSPPWASVSLSAASSAYSSFPFTTVGDAARSSRRSAVRRSALAAGSGTGLTRTTMFMGRSTPVAWTLASAVATQQRPGHDEPLDLLGALVELGDLGVAHHPLHGKVLDVAVASEDLHRIGGHGHGRIPGHELGERGPAGSI